MFSSTTLNEARANAAGWNWRDLDNNPDGPWGLPSTYIQGVDGSGTIGTIQPDNHLDFGIGAPGLFDQWTFGVKNTLTKVFKSHTIKMGGELTRMRFVDTAPWSARPSVLLQQHVGLPERCAVGGERHVRSVDRRADRLPQGHAPDAVALFVQDDFRVRPNLTVTLGLRWEPSGRSPRTTTT